MNLEDPILMDNRVNNSRIRALPYIFEQSTNKWKVYSNKECVLVDTYKYRY